MVVTMIIVKITALNTVLFLCAADTEYYYNIVKENTTYI